jgi:hypothetical protein
MKLERIFAGAAILLLLALVGSCSLVWELTDPSDDPYLLDEEFVSGINMTKYADVMVSSTLEESDDPVLEVFAPWYGFETSAINDGIVQALTPDLIEPPATSVAWSSSDQDPSPENSQWILYTFPSRIKINELVMYGRTDTMPGYGNPGANFPQDFLVYATNSTPNDSWDDDGWASPLFEDWASAPAAVYEYSAPSEIRPSVSNPGRAHTIAATLPYRYMLLRITRNAGDFTQIAELEVYGEPE